MLRLDFVRASLTAVTVSSFQIPMTATVQFCVTKYLSYYMIYLFKVIFVSLSWKCFMCMYRTYQSVPKYKPQKQTRETPICRKTNFKHYRWRRKSEQIFSVWSVANSQYVVSWHSIMPRLLMPLNCCRRIRFLKDRKKQTGECFSILKLNMNAAIPNCPLKKSDKG